jgi:hypothetical protein
MQESNERIILGIDPGTTLMGYGVIKGSGKNTRICGPGCGGSETGRGSLFEAQENL